MEFVWIFLGALVAGLVCHFVLDRPCGTLRIDHFNPEKDVYRFDIDDLDKLGKKKRIVLKVDNHADLSR